jgi:hypothetical protein
MEVDNRFALFSSKQRSQLGVGLVVVRKGVYQADSWAVGEMNVVQGRNEKKIPSNPPFARFDVISLSMGHHHFPQSLEAGGVMS